MPHDLSNLGANEPELKQMSPWTLQLSTSYKPLWDTGRHWPEHTEENIKAEYTPQWQRKHMQTNLVMQTLPGFRQENNSIQAET